MRECPPKPFSTTDTPVGSQLQAKSLFQNNLAVSPCGSKFCGDSFRSKLTKSFRINILGSITEKMWSERAQAKSLFWNILSVSPCGSIFCEDLNRSLPNKSLRMNILEKAREKKWRSRSCQAPSLCPANQPTGSRRGKEAHTSPRHDSPTANQRTRRKTLDAA
jgi:hypothetical protein